MIRYYQSETSKSVDDKITEDIAAERRRRAYIRSWMLTEPSEFEPGSMAGDAELALTSRYADHDTNRDGRDLLFVWALLLLLGFSTGLLTALLWMQTT